ncbi:MAG TPA: DNA-3-methyladenine glycosylase I [Chthoniobacterales bacterium]|jgi:DNA-3-methyladenine glycosylase I
MSAISPNLVRCPWCPPADALYEKYHDEEWGVPVRDGRMLFEMLNLEGAQAGLSWRTVLGKRPVYRTVFEGFDPHRLAVWTEDQIAAALLNPGIIRNRLKVRAVVRNARALNEHFGGDLSAFAEFLWSFSGGAPVQNLRDTMADYPSTSDASDQMSKALKKRDFTFVGSTICYAFMQAVGMVNDHSATCFRRDPVRQMAATWRL